MTPQGFLSLAVQSVSAPRDVARLLLSINPSREALATAFALVVVLNGLTFGLSLQMSGAPSGPALLTSPIVFVVLQGLTLAGTILAITWAGRGIGGAGRMQDVALLMIWLQALRVLVQGMVLLIIPLSQLLAGATVSAATVLGIWIAVHFVNEAHGLDNLWRAALVLILAVIGVVIALSILLTLIGVDPNGVTGYV